MSATPPALLSCVEIETGESPRHAVIWLHGLGADGHDFEPIVGEFDTELLPPLRFVFPHAPARPVTINGGFVMRAWYDIVSADFSARREDPAGVRESALQVEALIARENARGVEDHHLILAGFSQGGAIALHTGLRHPRLLAGITALSTYVPLADSLAAEANDANRKVPIFQAHGRYDGVIPHDFGKQSGALLESMDYPVEWHSYPMEHGLCLDEVRDIEAWMSRCLSGR